MSSASLIVAHRSHPDLARIASMSAAIALNLTVILIATRPLSPTRLTVTHRLIPVPVVRLIEPPAMPDVPPPVELLPLPHPATPPQLRPRPLPSSPPAVVPDTDGRIAAPPISAPSLPPTDAMADPMAVGAPVEASLAYRLAPLQFPIQALRERMHGTVLLRVLVDETGKPLQVVVERGSGYALLDRSARQQVLAGWRFQPAMVHGRAVRAWARVPVNFDLRG